MNHTQNKSGFLALDDQAVSFAELFFDLVFVYAITQVVHLMHGAFDWAHLGQAVLVFWLVWWGWTQYSWALNAADTRHRTIQIAILTATSIAFFMAVSVPEAFGKSSMWFAGAYVLVRSIGLMIYLWVTWPHEKMREAVKTFAIFSVAGLLAALAGGYAGGKWQYIFWGMTILLDVLAAAIGGRNDSWNLHPRHFAERHGLFIIIALGETLIIAAGAVTEDYTKDYLLTVSILSIGITCGLWWIYFFRAKDRLEHAMAGLRGAARSEMARDAYSLLHFPIMCGLLIYAYAIQEAMAHPDEVMAHGTRLALALGIFIFSMGIAVTHWRGTRMILYGRFIITALLALVVYALSGWETYWVMSAALTGLLVLCVWEEIFCPFTV